MEKKIFNSFNEVINNVRDFVEDQRGKWDHIGWESFVNKLQDKGQDLTFEAKEMIGNAIESAKDLYNKLEVDQKIKPASDAFDEIINNAKNFITKQKGTWDHIKWENFLEEMKSKGVTMTDDTKSLLGSVLESLKKLYVNSQAKPAKK